MIDALRFRLLQTGSKYMATGEYLLQVLQKKTHYRHIKVMDITTRLRVVVGLVIFFIENVDLSKGLSSSYEIKNYDLTGIQIWATAPEGNMTQGEVTFETVNGQLTFNSGFGVDVLSSLQIALGFSVKVIPTKGWAQQFPNGSWFGMAREILDGHADIAIAKTSILPNRAKDLAYLIPTHGLGLYAFFVQPSSKMNQNIFLDPFETNLWICIFFTYLVIIGSVKVLANLARFSIGISHLDNMIAEECGILSFYFISQKGYHCTPKLTCFRIALISGVILGLVIYVSYSATLVSMFSIDSVPIKSITDLLRSQIHITIDANNQAAKNLIQELNQKLNGTEDLVSSLLRKRLKGHIRSQLITAVQGGKHVLNAQSAFLTFKDTFYTTARNTFGAGDTEFCGIAAIPVTVAKFRSGLFVSKGSPLREPFNTKIIAMYNYGLMRRLVKNYEDTYTPTCDPKNKFSRFALSIDLPDVIFAFYGTSYGYCGAFCIYLIEIAYFRYHRRKTRKCGTCFCVKTRVHKK